MHLAVFKSLRDPGSRRCHIPERRCIKAKEVLAACCWERWERDAVLLVRVLKFHTEKVILQKGNILMCPLKMVNWQYLYKDLKVNALMVTFKLLFYWNIELLFHTATLLFAGIHHALPQCWKYISQECDQRTCALNIIFSQPFKFHNQVPHNSLLPEGNSF